MLIRSTLAAALVALALPAAPAHAGESPPPPWQCNGDVQHPETPVSKIRVTTADAPVEGYQIAGWCAKFKTYKRTTTVVYAPPRDEAVIRESTHHRIRSYVVYWWNPEEPYPA